MLIVVGLLLMLFAFIGSYVIRGAKISSARS